MSTPPVDGTSDADTVVIAAEHADNVISLRPRTSGSFDATTTAAPAPVPVQAPLEQQLEALLFVSPTPLTTEQLAAVTDVHEDDLHECLLDMMQFWAQGSRGIVLERVAGGWAFRASDHCADVLQRFMRPQGDAKLSPSALETLTIVAYLQPVSRPDIARIRGVSVDAAMSGLLDRGFIEEAGRSETGAVLFRTTALFERAFGLPSLSSLPDIEGFGPSDEDVTRMREQLENMASARVE